MVTAPNTQKTERGVKHEGVSERTSSASRSTSLIADDTGMFNIATCKTYTTKHITYLSATTLTKRLSLKTIHMLPAYTQNTRQYSLKTTRISDPSA
jgi:hypothetical protein